MKLLLDTHTFLWFIAGHKNLSSIAREKIENIESENFISIASLWEISIKTALGKLAIKGKYESVIDDVRNNGFLILPISFEHTVVQNKLPFYHRDPFDRIIISQAIEEKMAVLSKDKNFDAYFSEKSIKRIW